MATPSVEEGPAHVLLTESQPSTVPAEAGRGGWRGLLRGLQAPPPAARQHPPAPQPRAWPLSLCPGDLTCCGVRVYLELYLGHIRKQGFQAERPAPPEALEHKPAQPVAGETPGMTPHTPASLAGRHAQPSTSLPHHWPPAQPPHAQLGSPQLPARGGALGPPAWGSSDEALPLGPHARAGPPLSQDRTEGSGQTLLPPPSIWGGQSQPGCRASRGSHTSMLGRALQPD